MSDSYYNDSLDEEMDEEMDSAETGSEMAIDVQTESVSGRSHAGTVSTLYPEDSISQRGTGPYKSKQRPIEEESDGRSIVSFHSSVDGFLYKDFHGRSFSSKSDTYMLPGDDEEHARLDMQHDVLKILHNGLYVSKEEVKHALRQDQDVAPAVIDIGTGSGRWAFEMAKEFPYAEVVGLDLVPPTLPHTVELPINLRYEVDDANQPMDHYYNCFNVVHCRSCDGGIVDMQSFLYEIARVLRPDGVLLLIGGDTQAWGEDLKPLVALNPSDPGFSWTQYSFYHCHQSLRKRGTFALEAAPQWTEWLKQNPNYRDVRTEFYYIPLGTWKSGMSEKQARMSYLMAEDIKRIVTAFKPLFLSAGLDPNEVDTIEKKAKEEIDKLQKKMYIRFRYTTAIRTHTEWQPRPELPPM